MSLLIEDSQRNNLVSWTAELVQSGYARGAVLSPFATPVTSTSYKPSGIETVQRLQGQDAEAWFDPMTHALQMDGAGDYRYYSGWDLWSDEIGDLSTPAARADHVGRVFGIQDELGVPRLAPTILLHSPESDVSQQTLELARAAVDEDQDAYLSVAGDFQFWSAGRALDAHIGALSQLSPAGWFLTVVRSATLLPVPVTSQEIHGTCRTARSLSEDGPVHVSFGDLAGLPAIAAGASSVGTGWDIRQRICAHPSYAERADDGGGGAWLKRALLEGLLGLLTPQEGELLEAQRPELSDRLVPGSLPPLGPKELFFHHARVLHRIVSELVGENHERALQLLAGRYRRAEADWPHVAAITGASSDHTKWVIPLLQGLTDYGVDEGW